MSNTSNSENVERIEVITSVERRRRWSVSEKLQMVEESDLPGMSVSSVARRNGVSPSQLFTWRRLATCSASVINEQLYHKSTS